VALLFFEPSTRTRSSFEIAAKRLGAETLSWTAQGSSVSKGETLLDTVKNLEAMGPDALVVRHPSSGAPQLVAAQVRCAVVNAGDGAHEHPSQALLDAFTLRERWGSLEGRTVAIVGDIGHSRVARSNLWCLTRLGATVRLCAPPTMMPEGIELLGERGGGAGSVSCHERLEDALRGADAVMMLRLQLERQGGGPALVPTLGEYARRFGLSARTAKALPAGALVLHPGPINRGVELSHELADGAQSVVLEQVANGVPVRMAIFASLLGEGT
ncbi:MAG: aspartate carbamoyltransferase catalytic subunit, partial [Deltaproteobacteria bacterium]